MQNSLNFDSKTLKIAYIIRPIARDIKDLI
jgi:hypothetical protein